MSEPEAKTAKPQKRAARSVSYPNEVLLGLFFVQRYRFLKIDQFAKAASLKPSAAAEALRSLKTAGWVDTFGGVPQQGRGRLPTVYYLKRKGWEGLRRELPEDLVGPYREVHSEAKFKVRMEHREKLVDCLIALEVGVRTRPNLSLLQVFVEYRMQQTANGLQRETTDLVGTERIIPDAAFILRNKAAQAGEKPTGLYFLEIDMGTETIVSKISDDPRHTLLHKLQQYDCYLQSDAFITKYSPYGKFERCLVLFVTTTTERMENMRKKLAGLPEEMGRYYRFNTFDVVTANFFNDTWKIRSKGDNRDYPLVRG